MIHFLLSKGQAKKKAFRNYSRKAFEILVLYLPHHGLPASPPSALIIRTIIESAHTTAAGAFLSIIQFDDKFKLFAYIF
jgi:hypothetical protein